MAQELKSINNLQIYFNDLLNVLLKNWSSSQIPHGRVFQFLLKCYDMRLHHNYLKDNAGAGAKVENMVSSCVLSLALKCSDVQFRSLVEQFFTWADSTEMKEAGYSETDIEHRQLALLHFLEKGLDQLKELFTPFVIPHTEQLVDLIDKSSTSLAVRTAVLSLFSSLFRIEKQHFSNAENLATVLMPLLGQAQYYKHSQELIQSVVIPPLVNIIEATGEEPLWKVVLESSETQWAQSSDTALKLAFVHLLTAWFENFGEHFIALLSQMIPFLSELMEDPDVEIEQACQKLTQVIGMFLGEGETLSSYFNV